MPVTEDAYTHGGPEFPDRIVAHPDPDSDTQWPVESGRYRLIVSLACPWASRAVVVRRLLGLEDAIGLGVVDPLQDERSWRFTLDPGDVDPVLGIELLSEAYTARRPDFGNGVSVPAVVDVPSGQLVTNDFHQITLDLTTQWTAHQRAGAPDLYPEELREEMQEVMGRVYRDLNDAVYGAGFAGSQSSYEKAYRAVFDCLDWLHDRLADRRFLMGETITEADVRLFTTLVRFDTVYNGHFKCNRNTLREDPVLWAYLRDLYQKPGFGDTVNHEHIKQHYYRVMTSINPHGIVPLGPDLDWDTPHNREQLGGSPYGHGTPPTAPCDLSTYRMAAEPGPAGGT